MSPNGARESKRPPMFTIGGLATSRGFVAGPVFIYGGDDELVIPEYIVSEDKVLDELGRFHESRSETRKQLLELADELRRRTGEEPQIFVNHLAIFDDEAILSSITSMISNQHLNAETAIRRTIDKYRAIFSKMDDPYLKERVRDIDDLEKRILRNLMGRPDTGFSQISQPVIIVADDLTPSETITLPAEYILGFATDRGSTTSHVALLARSLGIPAVVGLGDITQRVAAGDYVLLDGTNGVVTINPDEPTKQDFDRYVSREKELFQLLEGDKDAPGAMKDGHEVTLLGNAYPGMPVATLKAFGAAGIGLYRSEYLWLSNDEEPSEEEQTKVYTETVKQMGPDAVTTIRVLDIGGDKLMSGMDTDEANPFLGNRSIRYLLSHRETFRTQLRAILRASAFGKVQVMYPMVATLEELRAANAELFGEMARLRMMGIPFDPGIKHGVMIELPAAALNAESFAREADFFSLGTNDLIQYTLASDRGNKSVAYLNQPTNPAVLKLVDMAVSAASRAGIPVAVCGETASDPVLGLLWIGMGVTALSMSASYIPVIKKVLRELSYEDARKLTDEVRGMYGEATASEIYSYCRDFLMERAPDLTEIQTFFMHD